MKTLLLVFALSALPLFAQTKQQLQPDPGLMSEINQIKAIDNHSHPPALDGPHGEKDTDFDALPCDPLEPTDAGLMFREDNPVYIKAWQTMFGYKYTDRSPDHVKELLAAKAAVKQREGDNYPNWVLDQLGIETELANRIALGRGHQPPHFLWVPFDDILLFPLNNSAAGERSRPTARSSSPKKSFCVIAI